MSPYGSSIRGTRRMSQNESLMYRNEEKKVSARDWVTWQMNVQSVKKVKNRNNCTESQSFVDPFGLRKGCRFHYQMESLGRAEDIVSVTQN